MSWKSKDFYLSSVVRASGALLIDLETGNHDFVFFVFDISPKKAEVIITSHWNRELKIPTRDLIEAINELKTRIYSNV